MSPFVTFCHPVFRCALVLRTAVLRTATNGQGSAQSPPASASGSNWMAVRPRSQFSKNKRRQQGGKPWARLDPHSSLHHRAVNVSYFSIIYIVYTISRIALLMKWPPQPDLLEIFVQRVVKFCSQQRRSVGGRRFHPLQKFTMPEIIAHRSAVRLHRRALKTFSTPV